MFAPPLGYLFVEAAHGFLCLALGLVVADVAFIVEAALSGFLRYPHGQDLDSDFPRGLLTTS